MKKHFKLLTTILFAVSTISSYSAFMVTQTSFGVDLARPITEDTTLINQGDKTVRVRVDFEKPNWTKDEHYLGDQLVAYPKIVIIPPKGKIEVKIAPRIKKGLEDGEYVALLMFKEIPPRNTKDQVTMLMNVGVPYYGRKGKLVTGIDFEDLKLEKTEEGYELLGTGKNIGNFSYNINVGVKLFKNKKLIAEETFKQGFYRDALVKLKKSISLNARADYAEVIFENERVNFSKGFTFDL
jgi:P pilus assembly chaperone PapD